MVSNEVKRLKEQTLLRLCIRYTETEQRKEWNCELLILLPNTIRTKTTWPRKQHLLTIQRTRQGAKTSKTLYKESGQTSPRSWQGWRCATPSFPMWWMTLRINPSPSAVRPGHPKNVFDGEEVILLSVHTYSILTSTKIYTCLFLFQESSFLRRAEKPWLARADWTRHWSIRSASETITCAISSPSMVIGCDWRD